MKVINSQSITDLRISVPNYDGDEIRLKDCDQYTVKVYTNKPDVYVEITQDDELKLYGRKMKSLDSGSIHFDISYSVDGYSTSVNVNSGYYYQKTLCRKDPVEESFNDMNNKHVYTTFGEIKGQVTDNTQLVNYIAIQIDKNIHKMRWESLTKSQKEEAAKIIGADLAGFTNVLSEEEYDLLVEQEKVDDNTFYFIYENE